MVQEGKSVSIEYTVKLDDGTMVDTNVGSAPLTYVQGEGRILPALQQALAGLEVNERKQVRLTPDESYGTVDPEAFQKVELQAVPESARHEGAQLVARDAAGTERAVRVHEVADDAVTIDLNHPLAGEHLNFEVRVVAIEDAPAAS